MTFKLYKKLMYIRYKVGIRLITLEKYVEFSISDCLTMIHGRIFFWISFLTTLITIFILRNMEVVNKFELVPIPCFLIVICFASFVYFFVANGNRSCFLFGFNGVPSQRNVADLFEKVNEICNDDKNKKKEISNMIKNFDSYSKNDKDMLLRPYTETEETIKNSS